MKVLQVTPHFYPNIGGVETHLADLVEVLARRKISNLVLTYRPLVASAKWKILEKKDLVLVFRIPWPKGLYYKVATNPLLDFLYIFPGLFIFLPILVLFYKPNVIHAHGIVAATACIFWKKIFNIRLVTSIHNIYSFPPEGVYKLFIKKLLKSADQIICLSRKSAQEIIGLGLPKEKVGTFKYWVDLTKFKPLNVTRKKRGLPERFTVLFVGRLIKEKGIDILIEAARRWDKRIQLVVIGTGPKEEDIKRAQRLNKNIIFLGGVDQDSLSYYYNVSDLLVVPSISEEGFGRVIIEALACSLPVVAADRGSIHEVVDESVARIFYPDPKHLKDLVEYLFQHTADLNHLKKNARKYAERQYSERNVNEIIKIYTD